MAGERHGRGILCVNRPYVNRVDRVGRSHAPRTGRAGHIEYPAKLSFAPLTPGQAELCAGIPKIRFGTPNVPGFSKSKTSHF